MYLKDGREIIEDDRHPGYYIDQSNGAWCDEHGNYVGGNADDGDEPGGRRASGPRIPDVVFVSKTGKQYYPKPNKTADIPMSLDTAHKLGLKPSPGYEKFVAKIYKQYIKKMSKSK